MIPHWLPTGEQVQDTGVDLGSGGRVFNIAETLSSFQWTPRPVRGFGSAATLTVILYYLLLACGHRTKPGFSFSAGGLSSLLSFVHSSRPPSPAKALLCSVVTSINETLSVTISLSLLPTHTPSPGLTLCAPSTSLCWPSTTHEV